jgi:serine/threonine protein kinase
MNITINPAYQSLTPFIENLPNLFEREGELIYDDRNQIKRFCFNGFDLTVKRFKVPHLINRIAYTFFRKSKAERSYKYSQALNEKGIKTPLPIAYIEEKKTGLLSTSYYISTYIAYSGLMRELAYHRLEKVKDLTAAFAHFTAFIHKKGIMHIDYSPGNILYEQINGQYNFCLVDLNRIKFGKADMKTAAFNLRKLWGSDETIALIASEYAKERGFDEKLFVDLTLQYHKKFWNNFSKRHPGTKAYIIS